VAGGQSGHDGPLAEFVALRQEIERRNLVQHGLFVLQLTSAGAILSFALSGTGHSGFLLIQGLGKVMQCPFSSHDSNKNIKITRVRVRLAAARRSSARCGS
jgi:hypothetical protein